MIKQSYHENSHINGKFWFYCRSSADSIRFKIIFMSWRRNCQFFVVHTSHGTKRQDKVTTKNKPFSLPKKQDKVTTKSKPFSLPKKQDKVTTKNRPPSKKSKIQTSLVILHWFLCSNLYSKSKTLFECCKTTTSNRGK